MLITLINIIYKHDHAYSLLKIVIIIKLVNDILLIRGD